MTVDAAEAALLRAAWQPTVLAPRPKRLDLLRLRPSWALRRPAVRVHRNHAFEVVTSVWGPFCGYAGLDPDVVLGPYDDSLDLVDAADPVELHLVSLDLERYRSRMGDADVVDWLAGRLADLTSSSSAPVLVANRSAPGVEDPDGRLARAVADLPGVTVVDVAAVTRELGEVTVDPRRVAASGTPWTGTAAVAVARELGLRWLPAVLGPPVKAVVVDLDGTLYDGVLGEDGPRGVRLTGPHRALQQHLVELRRRGVFVGVVSRNEAADVAELFRVRADFPLRPDDVSAAVVDWGSKADGVAEVAAQLRIAPDAVAFLDDNPGELATVASAHPGVRTLHAADPGSSLRALVHCPGLTRARTTADDARRVADLAAGAERSSGLARAADPTEYLRSLRVQLRCRLDDPADLPRVAQLAGRTNQFATSLLRPSEGELVRRVREGSLSVVAVDLQDRLSDSGTVAALLAHRAGTRVVVEGLSISCRALGRRIETALVEAAVGLLADDGTSEVHFRYVTGPRNAPALAWLAERSGTVVQGSGTVVVGWDAEQVRAAADLRPVSVTVGGRHDSD